MPVLVTGIFMVCDFLASGLDPQTSQSVISMYIRCAGQV